MAGVSVSTTAGRGISPYIPTPRLDEAVRSDLLKYGTAAVTEEALKLERDLATLKAERDRQAEFIACLRNVLGNILNDLPVKRDWLDPTTERIACEYVHKGDVRV